MHNKLSETIGHHVSGLRIASISNTGHKILSLESSSHSAVNTLGFPPAWPYFVKSFRLMTNELLGSLLDDNSFGAWNNHDVHLLLFFKNNRGYQQFRGPTNSGAFRGNSVQLLDYSAMSLLGVPICRVFLREKFSKGKIPIPWKGALNSPLKFLIPLDVKEIYSQTHG